MARLGEESEAGAVALGIAHLGRDQVAMIEMALEAEAVPYALDDDHVVVPVAREAAAARRIIADVEVTSTQKVVWFAEPEEPPVVVAGIPVAPRSARLTGWVADLAIVRTVTLLGVAYGAALWLMLCWEALYWIGWTGWCGRTAGKRVTRTRVIGMAGHLPSLMQASMRYIVPSVGTWASLLIVRQLDEGALRWAALVAAALWPVVVYFPLIRDPLRRGLHDRMAQTVVVVERRRRQRVEAVL